MRSSRTRSLLVTALVLALGGLGWIYLAPVQIGGSTRYMITHGVSMEPMLHTGDLVLVRPADSYRVGQVVAYHSTLLHTIVLHRIIRRQGSHYLFKGDNNNFIDPTHPTRAQLVGRMWLHIPHGGTVLQWLHRPWVAALLLGLVASFLLLGNRERRRRRDRRRRVGGRQRRRAPPVSRPSREPGFRMSDQHLLAVAIVGMAVFALLSVIAFVRPTTRRSTTSQPYSETVRFGYHASVRPSPVYPNGVVATGEPIYIQLVHRIALTAAYRLTTSAPDQLHGTIRIRGTLSNTTGWHRSFWLGPASHFAGNTGRASAAINLAQLESLTNRISAAVGNGGSYTLAVVPQVRVVGQLGGLPLATAYNPSLSLSLGTPQFLTGTSAITQPPGASAGGSSALVQTTSKSVTSSQSTTVTLIGIPVATFRWIAILFLALFGGLALFAGSREQKREADPVERINSRYKHLIVPVERLNPNPRHPPIEVSSIDALAQLAERSERLILHDHREDVDNYLIDDQGTLFRFTAPRVRTAHLNGNGTSAAHARPDRIGNSAPARSDRTPGSGDHPAGGDLGDEAAIGSPGSGDFGISDVGIGDSGISDSAISEPVTNATAAILSSAAAKLSAAAAEAASSSAHLSDVAPEPPADGAAEVAATPAEPRDEEFPIGLEDAIAPPRPRDQATPPRPRDQATPPRSQDDLIAPPLEVRRRRPSSLTRPVAASVATGGRSRSVSHQQEAGTESRHPPKAAVVHWSKRPQYRLGLTIGPLALTFLAWRRIRARRRRRRGEDAEEPRNQDSWTTRNLARR